MFFMEMIINKFGNLLQFFQSLYCWLDSAIGTIYVLENFDVILLIFFETRIVIKFQLFEMFH